MFISIIIPTYDSEKNIKNNLNSIKNQSYNNYELVIIDNCSNDKTLDIIKSYRFPKIKIISEKDHGIYDAINKGIDAASGDVISILHSDDYYYDNNVLLNVVKNFNLEKCDLIYSDLIYVKKSNHKKILRYWKSNKFKNGKFLKGWSPPHPTFIVKRNIYNRFGKYILKYGNSADIELMYRYLQIYKINYKYINQILIVMQYGGKSNNKLLNIVDQNFQIFKILKIEKKIIKIFYFIFF